MEINTIAVVGAGIMGRGIAEVVLEAGFEVVLVDLSPELLDDARRRIDRNIEKKITADKITPERGAATLERLRLEVDVAAVASEVDHVIEAVTEDLAVKRSLFATLDERCKPEVILSTNTSQFSVTSVAAATNRADRVIGTHWFNPPPVMDLIEIIRGARTSDETLATTLELAERYGKDTIVCQKDTQGFVTSRLLMLFILEAARIEEEGIASVEDINKACRLAFNHPMGPLDTADLAGLDTLLRGAEAMTEHLGDRFRPPQTLRRLVNSGDLGRKSGAGFSSAGAAAR